MAEPRFLQHAPAIEALIDLRVHTSGEVSVERLERALMEHDFGYHRKGPILRGMLAFVVNPQAEPPASATHNSTSIIGVRLHSADEKYVAQLTTEGFTLSRLEPYESWGTLIAEAQRVWSVYAACVAPTRVHRAATRFINNLRLPMKVGDRFERYLTGLPNMPPSFPQSVSSFLQRFTVHDDPSAATANITQALERFVPQPAVPVFLDIDVFGECGFAPDSPDIWARLEELRVLKNRIFFGALTEEAVELYT